MSVVIEFGVGRSLPEAWASARGRNDVLGSKVGYRAFAPLAGRPWKSSKVATALGAAQPCVDCDRVPKGLGRVREMFGLKGDRMVELFQDPESSSWVALRVSGQEEEACRKRLGVGRARPGMRAEVWVFMGKVS